MIYAFSVHWLIAPVYFLTVPLLGVLSSVLSRRIKTIQKVIVAETTALAGSTTESLRNIELVKSLGLGAAGDRAAQRARPAKILKLELKKVRYLRSLSFIQGTAVNLLRTSILFLMLYLIFTQRDHGRAVLLAVHLLVLHLRAAAGARERHQHLPRDRGVAERTSRTSCDMPKEPQAGATRCRCGDLRTLGVRATSSFTAPDRRRRRRSATSRSTSARGETIAFVGPSGAGQDDAGEAAGRPLSSRRRATSSTTASRATTIDLDGLRERIGFVTQDTQLFSGTIRENLLFVQPDGDRRRVPRRAAQGRLRQPAGARRQRARHGDRRGRRQGVGRREAAAVDRARAAAAAAPARVRRGDLVARLAHRGGDQSTRSATWPRAATRSRS